MVWTGSGPAVKKTISCVEIMKREHNHALYQITKICYRVYEEFWEPLIEDLDQIVVKRRVPMIHVFLSMDPLDENELGYQAPGKNIPFKKETTEKDRKSERNEMTKDMSTSAGTSSMNENKSTRKPKQRKEKI